MAQPVWVLSVDLQTKTATFQAGMADAARSARGAFNEISHGSGKMAEDVKEGSIDVRHSIGLVDNFIRGAHAQAIADLVRMYGQSAIVMRTLPLAATAAGIGLIGGIAFEVYEKMHKLAEEEEKLTDDTVKYGTAANTVFRSLDDKLLAAQKQADELSGNHLDALKKQLILIDHASMTDLIHSFGLLEKAADAVFTDLKGHWYSLGIGSDGAKHALEQFQVQYESLLDKGDSKGASDLLAGTLDTAKKVLALQNEAKANSGTLLHTAGPNADIYAGMQAQQDLRKYGVGFTDAEIKSQQQLVETLKNQQGVEERIAAINKQEGNNATHQTHSEIAARSAAAARESVESQLRMGESAIAGEKATADAQLTIHNASIEERLASDLSFASREQDIKEAANQAEIAALDKSGKDYQNQLKALNDKTLEITQQYQTQVASLKARASVEINQRDTQAVEQGIRQQIEATQDGTAARLAAIDAGIREEQARHLQDTNFYSSLLAERVNAARQAAENESRIAAEAAREEAADTMRMGELKLAAEQQEMARADSSRRVTDEQRMAEAKRLANEEYAMKMAALEKEIQGLDKSGKDYAVKLKQMQDREKELTQAHENEITAIKEKAEIYRNQRVLSSFNQFQDTIARGLTQSIMGHQTWSRMVLSIGDEVVSGMMQNAIKSAMMDDFDRERDAAKAARKLFLAGAQLPFPANNQRHCG
jgi:hypothetical protein